MTSADQRSVEEIADSLAAAWNSADAAGFAKLFAEDADFVNIYAMHFAGREGIAKQHQLQAGQHSCSR